MRAIRTILFVAAIFLAGYAGAQSKISGKVSDGHETLPYCTIQISGSTAGTTTDLDGNFELTLQSPSDTLIRVC